MPLVPALARRSPDARRMGVALALLTAASCASPPPDGPPPAASPAVLSPAPAAPAESAPSPDPPASAVAPPPAASSSPLLHDDPPWPDAGPKPKLILTWVAYPFREGSEDGRIPTRRAVELVARIGAVARRISLGDVRGGLFYQQHVCEKGPSRGGLVARVDFQEGGWTGFDVKRSPADTMTATSWYRTCGVCEGSKGNSVACPEDPEPTVAVFHVPADARVEERIVEVDGPGKEQRFECGAW